MLVQDKKTFFTDIDLGKLLFGEFQKAGKHLDGLAGRALTEQNKVLNSPNPEHIVELVEDIFKARISIMTKYSNNSIKHQTVTLFKDDGWVIYGYSNETGESGQLLYCSGQAKYAEPEQAMHEIVKIIMGN